MPCFRSAQHQEFLRWTIWFKVTKEWEPYKGIYRGTNETVCLTSKYLLLLNWMLIDYEEYLGGV